MEITEFITQSGEVREAKLILRVKHFNLRVGLKLQKESEEKAQDETRRRGERLGHRVTVCADGVIHS